MKIFFALCLTAVILLLAMLVDWQEKFSKPHWERLFHSTPAPAEAVSAADTLPPADYLDSLLLAPMNAPEASSFLELEPLPTSAPPHLDSLPPPLTENPAEGMPASPSPGLQDLTDETYRTQSRELLKQIHTQYRRIPRRDSILIKTRKNNR